MKIYKHKTLGWEAIDNTSCYKLKTNKKLTAFDWIPKELIENSSDWEEVLPKEEKDYKIQSFNNRDQPKYIFERTTNDFICKEFAGERFTEDCLLNNKIGKKYDIRSVKSLKTNLTWTVGDTTHHNYLIDNFYIKENECWVKIKQRHLEINDYKLSDLQPVKEKDKEEMGMWESFIMYTLPIFAILQNEDEPKEKETAYPEGIKTFQNFVYEWQKKENSPTIYRKPKEKSEYTNWVKMLLSDGAEIIEVINTKGEVFNIKDWVGFWIEGFRINSNNDIYAYCSWAFPDKTRLLSELEHKEKPKDIGNRKGKPLTIKEPKAETFETGKVFDFNIGKVYPLYYFPGEKELKEENAELKKESDKIRKSYFEVDGENVALRQKIEELTKENKSLLITTGNVIGGIDKLKQFCNSPINYL